MDSTSIRLHGVRRASGACCSWPSEGQEPTGFINGGERLIGDAAGNTHDQRDGCIDLLLRPGLARVDIRPRVVAPDHVADAPLQNWISIMRNPLGAHRSVQL